MVPQRVTLITVRLGWHEADWSSDNYAGCKNAGWMFSIWAMDELSQIPRLGAGNPAVRIESAAIRPRVVLTPLDRLEESPALRTPRQPIIEWLPHATLPEPLQEVHRWTGFAEAFTHASEGADRT